MQAKLPNAISMILPPIFTLQVDGPQNSDLSGLIFGIRIASGTKNLYHIYFPKTSANGKAQLTTEAFRGQFNDHGETFIMDYNGSIEAASDIVNLELYDPRLLVKAKEQISLWPLSKYEKSVWKSRQEMLDYFLSCRNQEFYFFEESVHVPPDGLIRATVGKRLNSAL